MTVKLPVCCEYTFTASTTGAKAIFVSALLVSIVIGTCVDMEFFLFGSSDLVLGPLNLVNIYTLALMLILANVEKQLSIAYINMDSIGKKYAVFTHCIRHESDE